MSANLDLEAALLGPLVAGRTCGGCTACCDVLKIDTPEFQKPAGTPCIHRSVDGCSIHSERPDICRAWFCGWRRISAMPADARPDLSGLMISLDIMREPRNCLEGVAIVVRALSDTETFENGMAEAILDLLSDRLVPIWLHDGTRKMLVHPDSEIAHLVITGDPPPAHLRDIVAAWRSRYGVFAS